jgi:ABC-type branched-subunit amino acid transport system substrate-binding protein
MQMENPMFNTRGIGAILSLVTLLACGGEEAASTSSSGTAAPSLKTDKGVNLQKKVIRIGALNDESGPAAVIGKPYASGKRLLAAQINAGGSGLLPDGWTVKLVERDHGYNPQKSTQAFKEISDQVLFIGTSFGTPNTLPLRPLLEAGNVVAFPASLSSAMAKHKHTPPLGPSYILEAKRAMDWIVASSADKTTIKAGIVYQQDDYGKDGHAGWMAAAKAHGVTVVAEQTVAPGQKDFTAVITGLKDAGADVVMLTTLPSATGPILGTAAQLGYTPKWVANTPAWIDMFFKPKVIPSGVFANYYQMNGMPFWGEKVPGMDGFLAAWEAHGAELGSPDFYVLLSYVQGLVQIEAAKKAINAGDITRAGYIKQLSTIDGWNAGGLIQPLSLTAFPYEAGTRTRVLRPNFETKSWTVAAGYAPSTGG